MKTLSRIIAALLITAPFTAGAVPITYDFDIQSSEGSATGMFTGDDLDSSGSLSAGEILSFMVTATGTAFTGGPFTIDAAEAIVTQFALDLMTLNWTLLDVSNGLGPFDGRETVQIFNSGGTLFVELGPRGSGRPITGITVTPRAAVPEPGTLALLGIGLAGLGFARRRKT